MQDQKGNLNKIIVVGDKVLIRPTSARQKTKTGLLLPPGYSEKEEIQQGYVVKVGPGYPIPYVADDESEPWKNAHDNQSKYMPLQTHEGDLAIFLLKGAIEILYNDEKYFIVPQHSILLLERDETLFT